MKATKKRFILSIIFLIAGVVYMIYPLDIIPDILGPIGWVDDIGLLLATCLYSAFSFHKKKRDEINS